MNYFYRKGVQKVCVCGGGRSGITAGLKSDHQQPLTRYVTTSQPNNQAGINNMNHNNLGTFFTLRASLPEKRVYWLCSGLCWCCKFVAISSIMYMHGLSISGLDTKPLPFP